MSVLKCSSLAVVGFGAALAAPSASALAQRTFVASFGLDTNPCSIALPCRGFAAAITAVAPGGEIIVLDSAGYGTFTISGKDVSIVAPPGIYAGISVAAAGAPGVTLAGSLRNVKLKGLTFTGLSNVGTTAIAWQANTSLVGSLEIERCSVTGFATGLTGTMREMTVAITDSEFQGNSIRAIDITVPNFSSINLVIARSRLHDNGDFQNPNAGGAIRTTGDGGVTMVVTDSSFVSNIHTAIDVTNTAAFSQTISIDRTTFAGNPTDVRYIEGAGATAGADLTISHSSLDTVGFTAAVVPVQLTMRDCVVRGQVRADITGTGVIRGAIANSTFNGGSFVVALDNTAAARVDVFETNFSGGNSASAIDLNHAGTSNNIRATIVGTTIRGYVDGVKIGNRTQAYLSRNSFTSNAQGVSVIGTGQARSQGDNMSTANQNPDSPPTMLTPY